MGIFDIFGTSDQTAAAQAQIGGINSGYNLASGNINQGINALQSNFGAANTALGSNYGTAAGALTTGANNAASSLTSGYGQGVNALQSNYASSLAPYLQNYGQAQGGVNQLGNVLGLNGPAGSNQALQTLQNTPGYQFQLQQGDAAINAQAAATGQNASGNQALALSNYNQGLAGTTYNNYVSQLQPFLGASNAAAGGIASGYQGLGQSLSGAYTGLGTSLANNSTNLGTGLSNNAMGLGNATSSNLTGLGTSLAGQYGNLGQLGYSAQTGIGNANANADLAGLTASGNLMNLFGSLGGAALGAAGGGVGGSIGSALGSSIFGAVPGASGPTSVGGAPLQNSAYSSIFSDVRLKEDIAKIGELYDGSNIYSYRYKGDTTPRIGLMAQEVEKTNPGAVVEIGGYKAVDYGKATAYAADLARFLEAA
jgi:hypothetical protein